MAAEGDRGYEVETCAGFRACPNQAVIGAGLAEDIKMRLEARDLKSFLQKIVPGPLRTHHEFRISIADCPNACSRPQIVDIGLIGACRPVATPEPCCRCNACMEACDEGAISLSDGMPSVEYATCVNCGKCAAVCPAGTLATGLRGYRFLVGGKLGRHPRLGTELPGIFQPEAVLEMVDRCLDYYLARCRTGERLGEIMERRGPGELSDAINTGH